MSRPDRSTACIQTLAIAEECAATSVAVANPTDGSRGLTSTAQTNVARWAVEDGRRDLTFSRFYGAQGGGVPADLTNLPLSSQCSQTMSALENFPRITPFLWFDSNAEEAVDFYLSVFKNSRRLGEMRMPEGVETPSSAAQSQKTKVLTIAFELDGQKFTALNGGPMFQFNESVSFVIRCDSQDEIDYYWSKLTAGGSESQCGWLKDKFGLSWQVVPGQIAQLLSDPRAMQALMGMKKIDIGELEKAAAS
jgi:predicted 3-demethylubiquinone-9 3-methyltransferase (glyoxalase superfamily)